MRNSALDSHPERGSPADTVDVPDTLKNPRIDRRSLLLGAVFLVGGGAALTRFTRGSGTRAPADGALTAAQFALLEQVSDVIIPATDTPGAVGAGVPDFLRELLTVWASQATRAEIVAVLDSIEKFSWQKFGDGFLELTSERRLEVMRAFDARAVEQRDPQYGKFKYLVLFGYYQSEVGATLELRYELVPGAWRSCLPLTEVGQASAV